MPDLMHHTKRELVAIIEKERREQEIVHELLDEYEITRVNFRGGNITLTLYGRVLAFAHMLRVVEDHQEEGVELPMATHLDLIRLLEQFLGVAKAGQQRYEIMCWIGKLLPSDVIVLADNTVNISSAKRHELVCILALCRATLEAFNASGPQLDQQLNGWIEVLNQPEQEREDRNTAILRAAGCTCPEPLLGETPHVGPRCRLCNTQGKF